MSAAAFVGINFANFVNFSKVHIIVVQITKQQLTEEKLILFCNSLLQMSASE